MARAQLAHDADREYLLLCLIASKTSEFERHSSS
jgi:hypothetical protein